MKRIQNILMIALGAALVSSCVSLKKVQENTPVDVRLAERMDVKKGVMPIELDITLAEEYTNRHTGIQLRPVLLGSEADGQKLELPPIVIEGKTHNRFNQRMRIYQPHLSDSIVLRSHYVPSGATEYNYREEVQYEDWMKNARLYVDVFADAYTKRLPLQEVSVAAEVFDLKPYIQINPLVRFFNLYEDDKFTIVKGGQDEGSDFVISFPTGSSELKDPSQFKVLSNYMEALHANPEIFSYIVEATIANSPQGTAEYNQGLGEKRIEVIRDLLSRLDVPSDLVTIDLVLEDWEGLRNQLPAFAFNHNDDILALIDQETDLDARERAFRSRYPREWKKISDEIFPTLCKADINVTALVKGADGKIRKHTADGFRFKDLYPQEVFDANAAMLDAIKNENLEEAVRIADSIDEVILPEIVRCNKGTVYMLAGRYNDARIMLERVSGITEAEYNLGLAYLLLEEWENADKCLDGFADLNSAIAKLYVGDYAAAADILKFLPDSEAKEQLSAIAGR